MSNDTHLQLEVIAELNWEPSVTAAHIGVAASAGVITLTGEVESYAEKHAAETAALRTCASRLAPWLSGQVRATGPLSAGRWAAYRR